AHFIAYATVAFLTASTVLLGGFAREQVCIYMCPWPRIQAAKTDEDTLVVAYREWRGGPRGNGNRRAPARTAVSGVVGEAISRPSAFQIAQSPSEARQFGSLESEPLQSAPLSRAATGEPSTGRRAPVLPMP